MHQRRSPYIMRRLITAPPIHLLEPPVRAALLPVLSALAKASTEQEIKAALLDVPEADHAALVGHIAGRAQYRHAMATVLRAIPRERLRALDGPRLARLYKAARDQRPAARPEQ